MYLKIISRKAKVRHSELLRMRQLAAVELWETCVLICWLTEDVTRHGQVTVDL